MERTSFRLWIGPARRRERRRFALQREAQLACCRAFGSRWSSRSTSTRILSVTHPEEQLRIVQREHLAVMDAIAVGDPDGARTAMHAHIDGACKRIFEGPPKMS